MINKLFDFINASPDAFNAIKTTKEILLNNGYQELKEYDDWNIEYNKKYFIIRNNSSIIAFNIPKSIINKSINIIASHTDSPCFKIKPNFSIDVNNYKLLNTEVYGGPIYSTWLDRALGISGRLVIKNKDIIEEKIINFNKDLLVIPNLAIHFNKEINSGYKYNPQIDLLPLLSNNKNLYNIIEENLNIKKEDILSFDLFINSRDTPRVIGGNNEFILSPRIDNLTSLFISLEALLNSDNNNFKIMVSFDNEEVGSNTKQGAKSDFLISCLERIYESLEIKKSLLYKNISRSMILSCDNAHALHPNHPNISDKLNAPILNKGFVIKNNANQRYTTDAISSAIIKDICNKNNILYQDFSNRSDIIGGSTLGNILQSQISVNMIDIGLPQLAMHSAVETCGCLDIIEYFNIMKCFYNMNLKIDNNKYIIE